jgi:hypothetical protein
MSIICPNYTINMIQQFCIKSTAIMDTIFDSEEVWKRYFLRFKFWKGHTLFSSNVSLFQVYIKNDNMSYYVHPIYMAVILRMAVILNEQIYIFGPTLLGFKMVSWEFHVCITIVLFSQSCQPFGKQYKRQNNKINFFTFTEKSNIFLNHYFDWWYRRNLSPAYDTQHVKLINEQTKVID